MSKLVIPGSSSPANLHLQDDVRISLVESDMFDICNRIREVDPNLFIVQLAEGDRCSYAVMERCSDGVERLVSKHLELDQRVVDKMLYLRAVPFEKRFAAIEEQVDKEETERKLEAAEELYESMGGTMYDELAKCGFVDRGKPVTVKGKL